MRDESYAGRTTQSRRTNPYQEDKHGAEARCARVECHSEHVGHIDRVVLNPKTKEITAVVVRKGVLFTHDKIVPIDMVDAANDGGVVCSGLDSPDPLPP